MTTPAASQSHHYPSLPGHERGDPGTFRLPDGTELRTRRWASAEPWARVLIVHGLSEHSGRYERVGSWLRTAGIDAWAYDHRGWGQSGGDRGHVVRFSTYHDDLGEMVRHLRSLSPAAPLVVYGHSMGGLISTGYVLGGRDLPDLLVLSAPGVDSTHSGLVKLLARVFGRVAPKMRPPNAYGEDGILSRDPEVDRLFRSDPDRVNQPTAGFGLAGLRAQADARAAIDALGSGGGSFPIPTLVLHGTADRLVPFPATQRYDRVGRVTRRAYEGLRHELHNEPEGEQVVADVIAWIREQLETMAAQPATTAARAR